MKDDFTLRADLSELTFFEDSPDVGPECICSLCGDSIEEPDMPLRLYRETDGKEARLHFPCWNRISPNHILPGEQDREDPELPY